MTSLSTLRRLLPSVALALAALASVPAAAQYNTLVVFGDSLSDNGNNAALGLFSPGQVITGNTYVPANTYASGTYSNGAVWATSYAAKIGLPLTPSAIGGTDFAFGGATTGTPGPGPGGFPFSLTAQVAQYLGATGNQASPNGLYVVEGGGNDARAALALIGGGANIPATVLATAVAFAATVGNIVDSLQAAGAKHIVVWDAPNLGLAPAVIASGAADLATFLTASMNTALFARLAGEPGVTIFDVFGVGTQFAANPGLYGFTNVTDACGAVIGANCNQYAYWDGIHPTAAAHRVLADQFAVATIPEPETWALLVGGLAALGVVSRRRKKAAATA